MKTIIVILISAILLLGVLLWQRDAAANLTVARAEQAFLAVSNELTGARMRVIHQEQLANVANAALEDRCQALTAMSNSTARVSGELQEARAAAKAAQARTAEYEGKLAAATGYSLKLEGQRAQVAEELRSLRMDLGLIRSNLAELDADRFRLANDMECLKIEKSELTRRWNDPLALRRQLGRLRTRPEQLEMSSHESVRVAVPDKVIHP